MNKMYRLDARDGEIRSLRNGTNAVLKGQNK